MKRTNDVVGFDFQVIALKDALPMVMAGDGYYADLKAKILEEIPNLAADQAFSFGLPSGKELPEDQRRGICAVLNKTLGKARYPWRVTYAGTKKLFLVVPQVIPSSPAKKEAVKSNGYVPKSTMNEPIDKQFLELRARGLSVPEIALKLNITLARARYLGYQKYAEGARIKRRGGLQPKVDKGTVSLLHKQGLTARQIAEKMCIHWSTVYKILREEKVK